jgi:hypothetical protein
MSTNEEFIKCKEEYELKYSSRCSDCKEIIKELAYRTYRKCA